MRKEIKIPSATTYNEAKYTTKWTAKGQKFIYDLLKELGINPNQ